MSSERLLPAALRNRTGFAMAKLVALTRQQCADQLAAVGLNQHQHNILCCLDEYGPACQKDIATRLGIDGGDIVAFIDGLQDHALVVRERDQRDRRRQILTITARGTKLLNKVEAMLDAADPGVLAALSERQRDALHEFIVHVLAQEVPEAWLDQKPPASGPARLGAQRRGRGTANGSKAGLKGSSRAAGAYGRLVVEETSRPA